MNDKEFMERLSKVPEAEPDALDLAMIAAAEAAEPGGEMELEAFRASLDGYNGKVLLRLPRSLHQKLSKEASIEGVSLNQYLLYKLAR